MAKIQWVQMNYSNNEEQKQCQSIINWLNNPRSGFKIINIDVIKTNLINTENNDPVYEYTIEVTSDAWN